MVDSADIATAHHPLGDNASVQHKVRQARPWAERIGRYGFGVRGAVYALVGALAAMQATGYRHDQSLSGRSALIVIAAQPFGTVLLVAIAVGFLSFGCWQLFSGIFLPAPNGSFLKTVRKRLARTFSGITQFALCAGAIGLIVGARHPNGDAQAIGWTAWLMAYPFGRFLVLAVGVGIGIFGLVQVWKGWKKRFPQQLDPSELKDGVHTFVTRLGQFGLMCRGFVFGIVAGFLITAAVNESPKQAKDLGGAMRALEAQPYGPWLLGAVAVGLLGYGVYLLVGSRYCRFRLE